MKNFLSAMFSNRFGIVLATTNLLYYVIKMPLFVAYPRPLWAKVFIAINAPALIVSGLFDKTVVHFFSNMSYAAQFQLAMLTMPVFIVLQWLFIAWAANKIAGKIQPKTP